MRGGGVGGSSSLMRGVASERGPAAPAPDDASPLMRGVASTRGAAVGDDASLKAT
jgi:hypothetical protein